ncbi:concanavalin A-like lectin/glucanase domain-containing protein [Blakeslea trispora]|nr:concanavalin A-like lectin/glucanase domain-containing protein [Blakeslea trispora]
MPSSGESFYAVIVICLFLLFSLSACLGFRLLKRMKKKALAAHQQQTQESEWQPLRSVLTPIDTIDQDTLQAVSNWQSKYPPNTTQYIDVTKYPDVIDKGVYAWKFIEATTTSDSEEESNAAVVDDDPHSIVFCQGQGSISTNFPVPIQEFSYWEVKVLQLNDQDRLAIGLATSPYPRWRIPGWHRHSIAYHSNTGCLFASDPVYARAYGPQIKEGDVIGVGYLCHSGTIFFTRNGQNLGKASIGFKYPVFPIIGSVGPCHVSVNFGHEDFLFSAANHREAAFAPREGSLLPPPAYGGHTDDLLFSDIQQNAQINSDNGESLTYIDRSLQPPPPSYS